MFLPESSREGSRRIQKDGAQVKRYTESSNGSTKFCVIFPASGERSKFWLQELSESHGNCPPIEGVGLWEILSTLGEGI